MPDSAFPIEVKSLRKTLGGKEVLKNVSLKVSAGELYVLVGPDGAGKTTFLRVLSGVMAPTAGEVRIMGYRVPEEISKIKGLLEYMPQRFSLYGDLTVRENIEFYRTLYDLSGRDLEEKKRRLLSITKLEEFEDRRAAKLSGGMQKKLALLISLIPSPKVLLLDEPTTGVDPISRGELWELFQDLLIQGITILLTTPYLDEAQKAHRVGFLFEGEILLEGTPLEMIGDKYGSLDEVFFDLVRGTYGADRG